MHKIKYTTLAFLAFFVTTLHAIDPIANGESGASARAKINASFVLADGSVQSTNTLTQTATARPVAESMTVTVQPASTVQQTTDWHGLDFTMISAGSQIGSSSQRLYPLEVTARHNTNDDLYLAVPIYALWTNTGNGDITAGVRGLRMWGKNTGTGTITDARFISIESPDNTGGGSITGLRGIKIEEMSDTFSDARGLDIAEPRNYAAGLRVGSSEVEPSLYRDSADGVVLAAASSFAMTDGVTLSTNDFTWTRVLTFDDYTPSSDALVWASHSTGNSRVEIDLLTTGVWRLSFTDSGASVTTYDITPAYSLINGTQYRITVTADRDDVATLYVDADSRGTVDISAVSAVSIGSSNTNDSVFYGDSNVSVTDQGGYIFNEALADVSARALSSAFLLVTDNDGTPDVSDFSSGSDGWSVTAATASNNQTVSGIAEARKVIIDGTSGSHYTLHTTIIPTLDETYVIKCRIYMPSGNSLVDSVKFGFDTGLISADNFTPTQDEWVDVSFEQVIGSSYLPRMYIWMMDGASTSIVGNSTDYFAMKDVSIAVKGKVVLNQPVNEGLGVTLHDASSREQDATITGDYTHINPRTSSRLRTFPASSTATGVLGQWSAKTGFRAECISKDTWERVAIATW